MIAWLKGKIIKKLKSSIVLDVKDVGYQIFTPRQPWKIGTEIELNIYHYIREDINALYGFNDEYEKILFEHLLSVPGVGPKLALTILGNSEVEAIEKAIAHGSTGLFITIPGIGPKMAAKIVVELKNKLSSNDKFLTNLGQPDEIMQGLLALGYSNQEIRLVINQIPPELNDVREQLSYALKLLGKKPKSTN